jgi:hypothetical protein
MLPKGITTVGGGAFLLEDSSHLLEWQQATVDAAVAADKTGLARKLIVVDSQVPVAAVVARRAADHAEFVALLDLQIPEVEPVADMQDPDQLNLHSLQSKMAREATKTRTTAEGVGASIISIIMERLSPNIKARVRNHPQFLVAYTRGDPTEIWQIVSLAVEETGGALFFSQAAAHAKLWALRQTTSDPQSYMNSFTAASAEIWRHNHYSQALQAAMFIRGLSGEFNLLKVQAMAKDPAIQTVQEAFTLVRNYYLSRLAQAAPSVSAIPVLHANLSEEAEETAEPNLDRLPKDIWGAIGRKNQVIIQRARAEAEKQEQSPDSHHNTRSKKNWGKKPQGRKSGASASGSKTKKSKKEEVQEAALMAKEEVETSSEEDSE